MMGVPYDQLRCPTCGASMGRVVTWPAPEAFVTEAFVPYDVTGKGRPYLTCADGHRWTIKELTRSLNRPDEVLLGDYIGVED